MSERQRPTHCPAGHEYSERNTLVRKDGRRSCRVCNRLLQKRKRKPAYRLYFRQGRSSK